MSFDPLDTAFNALAWEGETIADSAKQVWSTAKEEGLQDTAATLAAELALFPLRNIGKISSWALKGMGSLLWGTVKVGAQLAMLAPMPLPFGCNSIAEVKWRIGTVKDALVEKGRGNPRAISDIFTDLSGSIPSVRNAAQTRATTGYATAA